MSTPLSRETRKQATREALVRAATKLFASRGFAETSIDQIAAAIGLTKGAVYAHFDNKDALVTAVLAQLDTDNALAELRDGIVDPTKSLEERMRDHARRLTRLIREGRMLDMSRIDMEQYLRILRDNDALGLVGYDRRGFAILGKELEAVARKRKEKLPTSGRDFVYLWQTLSRGVTYQRLRDPESLPDKVIEAAFVALARM
jgi:AcrR family transcriptional regulator